MRLRAVAADNGVDFDRSPQLLACVHTILSTRSEEDWAIAEHYDPPLASTGTPAPHRTAPTPVRARTLARARTSAGATAPSAARQSAPARPGSTRAGSAYGSATHATSPVNTERSGHSWTSASVSSEGSMPGLESVSSGSPVPSESSVTESGICSPFLKWNQLAILTCNFRRTAGWRDAAALLGDRSKL